MAEFCNKQIYPTVKRDRTAPKVQNDCFILFYFFFLLLLLFFIDLLLIYLFLKTLGFICLLPVTWCISPRNSRHTPKCLMNGKLIQSFDDLTLVNSLAWRLLELTKVRSSNDWISLPFIRHFGVCLEFLGDMHHVTGNKQMNPRVFKNK